MRKSLAAALVALLLLLSYGVADVFDLVPGILTRTKPTPLPSAASPSGPAPTLLPLPSGKPVAVLGGLSATAPQPDDQILAERLREALADPALGPSVGVSVRDAKTGTEIFAQNADQPRPVASTEKILTAAAVTATLDPRATMSTKVVRDGNELVLVAGGDTLLAKGAGDPDEVAGRAGIGDLAKQVAKALGPDPAPLKLRLDATYAAGPQYPSSWVMADVYAGYTQGVSMIGFASQRPRPGRPSPSDPGKEVLTALADALHDLDVDTSVTDSPTSRTVPAPAGASVLGSVTSAAYEDVLTTALDTSDNALTENLARQASVHAGQGSSVPDAVKFVLSTLTKHGLNTSGTKMLDTSGLAPGQEVPVRLLSAVVAKALDGSLPHLADSLANLPVAGLDGTMYDRYRTAPTNVAAGLARAKTGTLTGISSLLGTTVDADGRALMFVIAADKVPPTSGTLAARAALDRFVATLTACGCN